MILPLPIYESIHLSDLTTDDGEILKLTFGLDKLTVDAFKKRSCDTTDEELQRFTSDHERMCLGSYETWYAKERYPFALTNPASELVAIAWFGPKKMPALDEDGWHTFAIRTYPPYRGKRLALPFAEAVFQAYADLIPHHPIWLDTDPENAGAIRLYQKLGFIESGRNQHGRVVMTRT